MMRSSITALILSITAVGAQSPHSGTPQAEITDYAWLDIQIGSRRTAPLRVVVGLYGKAAPLAVTNFIGLITCEKGGEEYCYRNSEFMRIIEGFIVQGGWLKMHEGGEIYMKGFLRDAFNDDPGGSRDGSDHLISILKPDIYSERSPNLGGLQLKHSGPGVVQMGNSGPNTNGPSFVFMAGAAPHLDGKAYPCPTLSPTLQLCPNRNPLLQRSPITPHAFVSDPNPKSSD